jgi:hypothetical protein
MVTINIPGTILLLPGWDAGADDLKDEEPELCNALKSATHIRAGKGYYIVLTCSKETLKDSILDRIEYYSDGSISDFYISPYEMQCARKTAERIRALLKT